MLRLACAFAAFLVTLPASAASLDSLLASAMAGTQTPGMAVLVIRDDRIADEGLRGLRRNDSPEPLKRDDVWHLGSDGKPMTATLIARLVDQGRLSWNATLSQMLPDLIDRMRAEYREVTLAQLLSHRAGLPHDVSDTPFLDSFYTDKRSLPAQRLAYVTRALEEAPAVTPGTSFRYSNTGYILAAVIAERAMGTSYEDLIRREIFQPLDMTIVGFGATREGQNSGHHNGKPVTARDGNPQIFDPAGNIYMNMHDWAKFCIDQMKGARGRGQLLKTATYQFMQTAQQGSPMGIGWGVADSVLGHKGPALTHAGSDGNWYALVVLFPQSGNGVLVAANAADDMGGDKSAKAVVQAVLPELAPGK